MNFIFVQDGAWYSFPFWISATGIVLGLKLTTVDFEVLCGHSSLAAAGHKQLFSWLTHPPLRIFALGIFGASWTSFLFKDTRSNAPARFGASYGSGVWFGSVLIHVVMWASCISIFIYLFIYILLFNPLNAELNFICYLLALLGAHHFFNVSRIRVKSLTLRLLMSYIYIYIYIWSTYS